MNHVVVSIMLS